LADVVGPFTDDDGVPHGLGVLPSVVKWRTDGERQPVLSLRRPSACAVALNMRQRLF
jgi:hypothetical protein